VESLNRALKVTLLILALITILAFLSDYLIPYVALIETKGELKYSYEVGEEPVVLVRFKLPQEIAREIIVTEITEGWSYKLEGNDLVLQGGILKPGQYVIVKYSLKKYIEPKNLTVVAVGMTTKKEAIVAEGSMIIKEAVTLKILSMLSYYKIILGISLVILTGGTLLTGGEVAYKPEKCHELIKKADKLRKDISDMEDAIQVLSQQIYDLKEVINKIREFEKELEVLKKKIEERAKLVRTILTVIDIVSYALTAVSLGKSLIAGIAARAIVGSLLKALGKALIKEFVKVTTFLQEGITRLVSFNVKVIGMRPPKRGLNEALITLDELSKEPISSRKVSEHVKKCADEIRKVLEEAVKARDIDVLEWKTKEALWVVKSKGDRLEQLLHTLTSNKIRLEDKLKWSRDELKRLYKEIAKCKCWPEYQAKLEKIYHEYRETMNKLNENYKELYAKYNSTVKKTEEVAHTLENEYVERLKKYIEASSELDKEWWHRHEEWQNYMKEVEKSAEKEFEKSLEWVEEECERLEKKLMSGQLSEREIAEIEKGYVSGAIANYKLLEKLGALSKEDKERVKKLEDRFEQLTKKSPPRPLPWREMWREYFSSSYRLKIASELERYFRENIIPLREKSTKLLNEWLEFCEYYHKTWKKLQRERKKALEELEKLQKDYQDKVNSLAEKRDKSAKRAYEEYLECLEKMSKPK